MKTIGHVIFVTAFLVLGAVELSGCGSPPPVRTAKKDVEEAQTALDEGVSKLRRGEFDDAKAQFDRAINAAVKGLDYASEIEAMSLKSMKADAISKKNDCDIAAKKKAQELAAKPKSAATSTAAVVAQVDPEAVKRAAEKAKEAKIAEENKQLNVIATPKTVKKVDEPEDAGDAAATKGKEPAKEGDEAAAPAKPKDPNGIYPDVTPATPAVSIVKFVKQGRFTLAYCQYYNKTDDAKRITVSNYFKTSDNQEAIRAQTAPTFAYDHFSTKVKDLIENQSAHLFTVDSEEVPAGESLRFVSVGESDNEAKAANVAKIYVSVRQSDGKVVDATGPAGMPSTITKPSIPTGPRK